MQTFYTLSRGGRTLLAFLLMTMALGTGFSFAQTAQSLPFTQNWSTTTLISVTDDWSGVAGIIGYRGDNLTAATGVDPQTVTADGATTPVNVTANAIDPNTLSSGGVYEFDALANPVVGFQGSGTADAPFLQIAVNTTGAGSIVVAYNLRDIDGSADNAVQPVALQYRVGATGTFTNLPAGFVADASSGPSLATLVTAVSATLPPACDNQPLVYIRIITANAVGNDEFIGVDDLSITGGPLSANPVVNLSVSANAGTEAGTTAITVTATASAAVTSSETVDLAVTGTGLTAGDYTLGNTTLTLLSGATTATTTFTIVNDTDLEGTETAVLTLSNPSAGILLGTTTQSIAIADDDNTLVITEIHPTGSSASYTGDWFEVTNTGTAAVDITGWKIDDSSNSFAAAAPLAGVTSIAPGQSVIFMEGTGLNNALFTAAWFGTNIPAGFTIGSYTASGIGLSSSSDAVYLFNALGNPITGVTFGAATIGTTFDNVANLTAVSQLSVVGVNGAFVSVTGSETGSPGTTVNPPPATVTLSVSANAGTEAGTTAITVTATAGNAVNGNQTVALAVTGTSITAGDYSLSNATITILNGATTGSETFTIVNDLEVEGTETATLTISSPSAGLVLGTTVSQNVAIADDDNTLVITEIHPTGSSASYTGDWFEVTNTGTVAANITGWKIDDSSNSFAAAAPLAGVTTIAPGQSVIFMEGTGLNNTLFTTAWFGSNVPAGFTIGSYTASAIGLSSNGDAVNLFNATGGAITGVTFGAATTGTTFDNVANLTAVSQLSVVGVNGAFLSATGNETGSPGTIVNSSTTPSLVNVSVSANAGTETAATVITVTATANQAVSSNQTVDLLVSGSGITTGDYSLSSTTITIPAGTTTGSVTFTVTDDALIEGAETATLTLSNPSAGLVLGTTISQAIVLTDNDAAGITLTQSAGTTTATEGGATDDYTLVLNAQPSADVTITLNPGTQLSLPATTFTFTATNWSVPQTVTVTAVNDLVVEGNHNGTISHTVASADAAYNGLSVADVTVAITDNDVATVTLALSAHAGSEASATAITVYAITPVNMPSAQTVTLSFSGAGITPGDYYAPTTITIPAGQDTGMATLVIADDAVQEGAETLTVTLGSPSALLVLGTAISDTVVITNNDCSFMNRISGFTSTNGAEIAAFDPASNSLYTVAGSVIEQFTMNSTGTLTLVGSLPLGFTPAAGFKAAPNSVSVKNGVLAAAYAVVDTLTLAQARGIVGFYTAATGAFLDTTLVGYLPDMVTFTPDGTKVMTANEGEPNSYGQATSFDPEGSVSIINIAGGVVGAPVQTATFTSYNSQLASLQAAGVRIYGPGATVAQDLEPEYIAFSADGLTAMVTLQENNALANIDIATATVTSIIPLGLKDHNLITVNSVDTFMFANLPILGATTAGQNVSLGGFSGLFFEGYAANGNLKFVTHTDRGPNGEPTGVNRPFILPNFTPEVIRFELNPTSGQLAITQRIQLKKNATTLLTGLPNTAIASGNGNTAYNDEVPVSLFNATLGLDPMGADLEGIVVAADGSFWMVDEYRPAIYHFDPTGVMQNRFVPMGTAAAAGQPVGTYGTEVLPAVLAQRRQNRGFEAVAFKDGKLYAFVQSPLRNPISVTNTALNGMTNVRVVEFDVNTTTTTAQYIYQLDNANLGTPDNTRPDKIGDAVYMGNGNFLVVERDDDALPSGDPLSNIEKKIYRFNLAGAANVNGQDGTFDVGGGVFKSVDQMTATELRAAGFAPISKSLHVDLAAAGYTHVEKVEGLAMIDMNTLAVINDNDFEMAGIVIDNATGTFTPDPTPEPVVLGIISTSSNGFDASDRDLTSSTGKINIQSWPVFGLYQPDAIASYTVDGNTYYVMANEGDTRAWTGFNEEVRVGATSYVLDPVAFPNAATLKMNANLGRLQVTNATGDLDNDGDFDQIFANGGRSFSIRNSAGALVFDSGDQLEQITAAKAPILFNSEGVLGGFDSRSGKKGPEPEGIAIGSINGKTYAFVGMERVGDLIVYDITDPAAPVFVQYFNTPEDQSPEGVLFVSAANSPTGKPLVISTHEVSNTVAVYEVNMPFVNVQETSGLVANDRILCPGATATLTASPGTSFAWSNGVTTNPNTVTTAGTYSVNITDANGCIRTAQATVSYTSPIVATVVADSAIACFGDSTSATVTVTSGVAPFSYLWSNGDTTATADSLESGMYGLIVEDDSACTTSTSITLTEPAALAAALDSLNDVTCFGAANGALFVTTSGGTAPYTYTWSNSSTEEDVDSLAGGSYTGIITDANGCVLTTSAIAVAEPALLEAVADTVVDVTCAGFSNGSVALTVSGGVAPYHYAWSNGDTTEDLTGLTAATYTGTITDANGCVLTATLIVEEPLALAATVSVVANACKEGATGSIALAPKGGTPAYQVLWNTGATGNTLANLGAGTYTATLTDANSCTTTIQQTVTNIDSLPTAAGTSTITGSGVVTFAQSSSANAVSVKWLFGDGTSSFQKSPVHTYTANGTYTVTLVASNFCGSDTITFPVTLTNVGIASTLSSALSLYPNPTEGAFSLAFEGVSLSDAVLELYSMDGKLVVTEALGTVNSSDVRTIALDRSAVATGVYTVRVSSAEGVMVKRLVIR